MTMPGSDGGTDTTQTSVGVNGSTSAADDGNVANNIGSNTLAVIDALNDGLGPVGSTAGGTTTSVLVNDQVDAAAADGPPTTGNVVLITNGAQGFTGSGTATPLTLNTSTGVITVPAMPLLVRAPCRTGFAQHRRLRLLPATMVLLRSWSVVLQRRVSPNSLA